MSASSIYLDHNAHSPIAAPAKAALVNALAEPMGNPGSAHGHGLRARKRLNEARGSIAKQLGARRSEIVFTSGGTESNNLAITGLFGRRSPKSRLISVVTEHPSALRSIERLERAGADVCLLPVDTKGRIDLKRLKRLLSGESGADVALVCCMLANNETGVLQDVERIAALCRREQVPFHCDAVQAVGKIPVDFGEMGVSTAAFTAHKLGGPIGIGGLYVAKGVELIPRQLGGGQERGLRAGTEPVALISAFAAALEHATSVRAAEAQRMLRDRFETALSALPVPVQIAGVDAPRLPNTSMFCLVGADGPAIMLDLDAAGIRVGTGSACHSDTTSPSHVLSAMGVDLSAAHGALRVSLGPKTTWTDLSQTLEQLETLTSLRGT